MLLRLCSILSIVLYSTAVYASSLPDINLTPGDTVEVSLDVLCTVGYTATVRNVPPSLRRQVFKNYNTDPNSDKFEVDHLISLELGGSNDIKNLWPESYTKLPYTARAKDKLENKLHKLICTNKLDLKTAQQMISTDWISAYHQFIGPL